MLTRIACHQARIGMFVERIEGDWIDRPLWFRSSRIEDEAELARLRDGRLHALVIDLDKGVGPLETAQAAAPPPVRPASTAATDRDLAQARRALDRTDRALRGIFESVRDGRSLDPTQARAVVDEIGGMMTHRPRALLGITRLKSKDEYSFLHSVAVCALMTHFGRFLRMEPAIVEQLGLAGLLHDVGKVAVPREILGKPGALTEAEAEIVRAHPAEGYRMLEQQDVSDLVRDVCLHHHERIDGRGYPDGLLDGQIALPVRIASICDVYDAVTSVRPYKEAWSAKTAYQRMWSWEGHFDRVLLGQFFVSIGVAEHTSKPPP